jgi:hypothetical protein
VVFQENGSGCFWNSCYCFYECDCFYWAFSLFCLKYIQSGFQPFSSFFLLEQKEPKIQDKPDPSGHFVGPFRTKSQTMQTALKSSKRKLSYWIKFYNRIEGHRLKGSPAGAQG